MSPNTVLNVPGPKTLARSGMTRMHREKRVFFHFAAIRANTVDNVH